MPSETLQELLEAMRQALECAPEHEPPFDFELALADDYEHLLSRDVNHRTRSPDEIINLAVEGGRLIMAAEAGAGKSSVTLRVLRRAIELGLAAIRVDLRRWTPTVDDAWRVAVDNDRRRMGVLLERIADVPTTERQLRRVAVSDGALIVIDGLNEVPPAATHSLLGALDDFAARCPWAGVLVCDRLLRRKLPSEHWQLATITRVDPPDGRHVGQPDNALLLAIAGASADGNYNEARILLRHLRARASLIDEESIALTEACLEFYKGYKQGQGRFFEIEALRAKVGDEVVDRLLASRELLQEGDRAFFRHHLFHDALAASALVAKRDRWKWHWFDALTFDANSFDAAALALELVDDARSADALVVSIYDWNLYAAAYAVSQGRRHRSIPVSSGAELALLAVLAERRWDPIAPSVQRVEDALRVSPSPLASRLLRANDLQDVIGLVRESAAGDPTAEWLPIFDGTAEVDEILDSLDSGPVPGWMAANTLRRHPLSERARARVLAYLSSPKGTVRWRAAHTLGSDSSDEAAEGLLAVLDGDDWVWVRYGAVRALIEMAAHEDDRRSWILSALTERLNRLEHDRLVFAELQRALELRAPPLGWASDVGPLIEELFMRASTVADQDHWRRVGRRITETVRLAREIPST